MRPSLLRRAVPLFALFAGAFLIRLLCVLAWGVFFEGPPVTDSGDDYEFNQLALNVGKGVGYRITPDQPPTSFRAPGFPLFLTLIYSVCGENYPAAHIVFCLLGAAACVLTFFMAREVLTDKGAWIAALLLTFYLPHAYLPVEFVSENLYVPCLALSLWLFLRAGRGGSWGLLVLAGLVLGWAALTRPTALVNLPILCLVLFCGPWRLARRLGAVVALAAPFVCVLLPWTVRNYLVHGQFVLIASNGGSTFYGANNDRVAGEWQSLGYWIPTNKLPHRDLIDAQTTEVAHDNMEWKLGWDWVKANPGKAALLEPLKVGRLWWLPAYGAGLRWLRFVSYVPFFVLFVVGAWRCVRERALWTWPWWAFHGTLLSLLATALVFFGEPRFRDAIAPVLMVYAATAFGMYYVATTRPAVLLPDGSSGGGRTADTTGVPA